MQWLKQFDTNFRAWLCKRYGHKFYVGRGGYYPGLPQAHCWRCGAVCPQEKELKPTEPLGGWFD